MQNSYYVVCVSEQPIPDNFKTELEKFFQDLQLTVSSLMIRKSSWATTLTTTLTIPDKSIEILQLSLLNLSTLYRIDIGVIPKIIF
jgi:hypothetical protein